MAKKKKTIVALLLDETGSMATMKGEAISGFNEYVAELAKGAPKTTFVATSFNSLRTITHDPVPVKDVPKLDGESYRPMGATPLYDAIGRTIRLVEEKAGKKRVLVTVLTDGYENASSEYSLEAVTALIKEKTQAGWEFAFIASSLDAAKEAQQMGIQTSAVYDEEKTAGTMSSLGRSAAEYAAGGKFAASSDWVDELAKKK